ncbi:hypothetical protein LTR64_005615 [Lithohypha guttulata]|uniref:uncharacterized protein n=1 Tax=Lithohypha guttulata TaxID=1690604 RepID=UPI002DE10BA1|nr:hypothetical protein LTR51_002591 [Lithohypha guttulata]
MNTLEGLDEVIVNALRKGINQYRYKNGAFTRQIRKNTSIHDALRVFINSPLVTNAEKAEHFLPTFEYRTKLEQTAKTKTKEDHVFWLNAFTRLLEVCEVFENDMRARGVNLGPPLPGMIQVAGSGRGIDQTLVFENDGTISKHEGGELGVIPGARPSSECARDVNRQQGHAGSEAGSKAGSKRGKKNKKSRAKNGVGDVELAGSEIVKGEHTGLTDKTDCDDTGNSANGQGTINKPTSIENNTTKPDDIGDFSAAFGRNARRFFD